MKKMTLIGASAILAGTLLSGCGWLDKANGLIVYGDEPNIEEVLKQEQSAIEDKKEEISMVSDDQYQIKIAEDNGEKVMVLSEQTAQALVDKELLREVIRGDKTEALKSVPDLSKGEAVLFAKEEQERLTIGGQELKAEYGSNSIIGDGRAYVDKFLVVDDADWEAVAGEEKIMAVLEYDKDPSVRMMQYDVEGNQLVQIKG
ncbi:hypothetical protein BN1080_01681 [Planococcus massiliensis]|uniref:Lipoprotein n=1 Tax=Planococcus massiliensis TaxID=1499687 RepID=A0A098EN75_9BACL|nr:lipoprotein BA_5634 family protein [Planococcus massiliensis]CEG22746.1 hypothetical protein BN1080_01681 [Planococcus massiliensis]